MTRRTLLPGHWNVYGRAVPDTSRLCCDGRCNQGRDCPLTNGSCPPVAPAAPVYQRPRERRGRGLATAVLAVALIAAGALLMLAPISAATAVASWVGPR